MTERRVSSAVTRRRAVAGFGSAGLLAALMPSIGATQEATPAGSAAEANKTLVQAFYDAFYGARATGDVDAIDTYVSPDYLQHEPGVPPGRDGLKDLIRSAAGRSPEPPPLLHLIAEGDIVVAHQVVPGPDPDGPPAAEGVDIFRVADGLLVEHWGVDVEYPTDAAVAATPGA